MVSRVRKGHDSSRRRRAERPGRRIAQESIIALVVISIFLLKIFAYTNPSALSPSSLTRTISLAYDNSVSFINNLPFLNSCPRQLRMQDVSGGYVCVNGAAIGDYNAIYKAYPLVGRGIESIYSDEDQGSVAAANDLLNNKFDIPRYPAVQTQGQPTWSENPFSANYWRFEFYSLRPSLNLLYAFRTTGRKDYAHKLISLDESFISAESKSRWAWSDPHAVAFRSMALVDAWWKLRQAHQLPEAASNEILTELEKTGEFLADPNHYQQENNHCVNEAAALYELATAFPTLPHAQEWLKLATQRFQWQLEGLIDSDGQLIENSPYYDFYALSKYWQVYSYSVAHGSSISSDFQSKLKSMLQFATYILQPNSQVPLLGASTEASINDHGVYQQMAATDPQLLYVLTHGAKGTEPEKQSVYFPASALTVMRSGWQSGAAFGDSTYLTYNIGKYRTAHSSLDALAITLYGEGGDLLPGAGLYTYNPGTYRNYFHGTESENTVVVDGKSQVQGNGTATNLLTTDGMTYQSAESSLYSGVTHQRMVMMIDQNHLLVVDRLNSSSVHTYQQMFHLFPGAKLSESGLTVSGVGGTPRRQVTIQQLKTAGITEASVIGQRGNHPAGLCSQQYGKLMPCYQVSYTTHARSASYFTLITIGNQRQQPNFKVNVGSDGRKIGIVDGDRHLNLSLGESAAKPAKSGATDPKPPAVRTLSVPASSVASSWTATGGGALSIGHPDGNGKELVARLSTGASTPSYLENNAISMDLSQKNAQIKLEVNGFARLSELRLMLSNDNWAKSETMNLLDAYTRTQSGNWHELFIGPSASWGSNGGWLASASGFDWSKIDGLKIEIASRVNGSPPSTVSVGGLSLIPAQHEGKLVFVFDDGYQSILPAAAYLHQNGMPGNV
jgi:hypothetical protein